MAKIFRLNAYLLDMRGDTDEEEVLQDLALGYDCVYQAHCTSSEPFELTPTSKELRADCDLAYLESHFKPVESTADASQIVIGGTYRHFKEGKLVKVIAVSRHSERPSEVTVVYECSNGVWSRPIDMFLSDVNTTKYPNVSQKKRFELVNA